MLLEDDENAFSYINRHPRPVLDLSRSGAHPFLHGLHEICSSGLPSRKRGFLREIGETGKYPEKWLMCLSKLILDFGLAKGKSAVEFREAS